MKPGPLLRILGRVLRWVGKVATVVIRWAYAHPIAAAVAIAAGSILGAYLTKKRNPGERILGYALLGTVGLLSVGSAGAVVWDHGPSLFSLFTEWTDKLIVAGQQRLHEAVLWIAGRLERPARASLVGYRAYGTFFPITTP